MSQTILANIIGCAMGAIGVGVYASGLPFGNKAPSFLRFALGLGIAVTGGITILLMTGALI